ncbi:serine/threonine-protein kinase [Corynebacterium casei]|uniref:serine/threonine-protein kinase n=1 Tax=Corynebacterium casei TaxID=160386 RepID=UPI003FD575A1
MVSNTHSFISTLSERHGFTEISEIGRGGMGVVYRAFDEKLQRYVAVKQLSTELLDEETGLARFRAEMVTLGRISHSAVVKIHFAEVTENGDAYFVMDYVQGENLSTLIRRHREWGNRFTVAETVELLRPIAAALDFLHMRMDPPIIHRDIKPANILVPDSTASESRSLLTDFGISLAAEDTRLTSLSMMIGTERYFAPELVPGGENGPKDLAHSQPTVGSDNYALSLIAFEMLTLQSLKDTMSPNQWAESDRPFPKIAALGLNQKDMGDVDRIEQVLRKSLHPAPAYRFMTATAFIQALAQTGNRASWQRPPRPPQNAIANQNTRIPDVPTPSQESSSGFEFNKPTMITLSALAVGLLVILGAIGTFAFLNPAWQEPESAIADAFPKIISDKPDSPGWAGLECSAGVAGENEQARIVCSDSDLSITFADFGSQEDRDNSLDGAERKHWEVGTCEVATLNLGTDAENSEDRIAVAPMNDKEEFGIYLEGSQAKDRFQTLPLC